MWQAHSCPSWAGPLPVLAWPGPGPASAVSHKTEGNIFQLYIDLASARLSNLANQNKQVIKSCVFSFSTPDYCDKRHRECSGCWSHGERVYLDAGIMNGWPERLYVTRIRVGETGEWGWEARKKQRPEAALICSVCGCEESADRMRIRPL